MPNTLLRNVIVGALLVAAIVAIYAQVRTHSYVNYDDPEYVYRNPQVLNGLTASGVHWAFTNVHAGYWHPVTWISHMLDVTLFGRDAGRAALVSVSWHALNALLLLLWLQQATGAFWRSTAVAALFAVHPMHVESVAWVAERKDVLSAFFMLLALNAYTRYVATRSKLLYAASIAALVLGLLSKPMLVTFPFVLLLIDWWPLKRRALLEKVPYFLAIVPIIAVTLSTQSIAMAGANVSLGIRIANAAIAYGKYIAKTFWPSSLAVVYPYPVSVSSTMAIICGLILAAITFVAVEWRSRAPYFTMGWFWFVGTMVPVIGLVQVGVQSMADRFSYIPHIGLFVAIVWGVAAVMERQPQWRNAVAVVTAVIIMAFAITAHTQAAYWKNSVTLFEHTLAVTSNNKLAHINLGGALLDAGAPDRAEGEYRAAAGFKPADIQHMGLALALNAQGKSDDALREAAAAVEANSANPDALATLGMIELARGHNGAADAALARSAAIRKDPMVLARLALARGKPDEARRWFAEAAKTGENADAHVALAGELSRAGNDAGAAREYEAALGVNPSSYEAHMNFGALLSRTGRDDDAIREFDAAALIRPSSPEPHVYAALAQANRRQTAAAVDQITRAIAIDHDAANRFLTSAIGRDPNPNTIDQYLAFLRQQAGVQ